MRLNRITELKVIVRSKFGYKDVCLKLKLNPYDYYPLIEIRFENN